MTIPPPSLAGLWARLTARAIDAAVSFGLAYLAFVGSAPVRWNLDIDPSHAGTAFILAAIPALEFFGTALWGATPGKIALGLTVTGADGTAASWRIAAVRTVTLAATVALWPLAGFILVGAVFSSSRGDRRFLSDRLSRTRVVVANPRRVSTRLSHWLAGSAIGAVAFLAVQTVAALSSGIPGDFAADAWWFEPLRSAAFMSVGALGVVVIAGRRVPHAAFGAFAAMIGLSAVSLVRVVA